MRQASRCARMTMAGPGFLIILTRLFMASAQLITQFGIVRSRGINEMPERSRYSTLPASVATAAWPTETQPAGHFLDHCVTLYSKPSFLCPV
jgi:hypothetical protein